MTFQHTFGEATLPLLISAFRSRHPQTEFDLSQGSRDSCLAGLASGTADLALTAPVAPPAGRSVRPRCTGSRCGSWCTTGTGWPAGSRRRWPRSGRDPFVAMGPGYGLRSLTDALFREAGFRPRIAFESQDSHTVRGLVSAGLGVSILPPGAARRRAAAHSGHRRSGLGGDAAGIGTGVP